MSDLVVRAWAADIVHKDADERMVYAIATGPKMDLDGQGVDPDWLRNEVPSWMKRGNIRLMHNPTIPPVGKAKRAVETPDNEWAIAIKVTDDKTWEMVDEGLLTGISIGAKNATIVADPRYPKGLIKGGDLIEMSLVDYPAYKSSILTTNPDELGVTFFKRAGATMYYNGMVIEPELPASVEMLKKVAGTLELPGVVRDRLERQRQDKEVSEAQRFGVVRNPYAGAPTMVVPGKTTAADLKKVEEISKSLRPDVQKVGPVTPDWTKEAAADIAKRFNDYDADYIFKRQFSDKKRKDLARSGAAEADGSYPIENEQDLKNAIQAYGRSKNKGRTKAHIISRAKSLGATSLLPDGWSKFASLDIIEVVPVKKQGLVVKCGDCYPAPLEYFPKPRLNDDGKIEFQSSEAKHNAVANAIVNGLKQFVIQEMDDDDLDFDDVKQLADIAQRFLAFCWDEQLDGENKAFMDELGAATTAMVAEPDRTKRTMMAQSIAKAIEEKSAVAEDTEKAAKGGAGNASAKNPKDAKDDGPTGGENVEGSDEGDMSKTNDTGKRSAKPTGQKPMEKRATANDNSIAMGEGTTGNTGVGPNGEHPDDTENAAAAKPKKKKIGKAAKEARWSDPAFIVKRVKKISKLGATLDVKKVGARISRDTANQLLNLARTPGTPANVKQGLEDLAGFALQENASEDMNDKNKILNQPISTDASRASLPREKVDWAEGFGSVMAEVSSSFVTPTGKAATPEVTKAADLFKQNVSAIAVEALEKFVTGDAFTKAIATAISSQTEAAKATEVAKAAEVKAGEVAAQVEEKVAEVKKTLEAEIERIKQLPQPPKGIVAEGTHAQERGGEVAKAATSEEALGAAIMKRAVAGDPTAQRILREAAESAGGQTEQARLAYAATVTGKPATK